MLESGIEARQIDASIEAIHYILSPERIGPALSETLNQFDASLLQGSNDQKSRLSSRQNASYIELLTKRLKDIWVEDRLNIQNNDFNSVLETIDDALWLSTLRFYPHHFSLSGYEIPPLRLGDQENPFIEYYEQALIPQATDFCPDLIGISYGYAQQIAQGRCITTLLGKSNVQAPVIVGGAYFSRLCKNVSVDQFNAVSIDYSIGNNADKDILASLLSPYGIQGEGEIPLLRLCQKLISGDSFLELPNLVTKHEETKTIAFNSVDPPVDTTQIPVLSLEGLPIGRKYTTPIPMAPVHSSRGCYWNKCAFCDHATLIDSRFRRLPIETVVQTLKIYNQHHGVKFALFCDEGMPVSHLKKLADASLTDNVNLRFGTMARIEEPLQKVIKQAANAGLSFLSFGLESGCPRIVSLMNKGFLHQTALDIIDECHRQDVFVELHIMFGFPTEEPADAQKTIDFLDRVKEKICCVRANPWFLTPYSPIGKNLQEYGVVAVGEKPIPLDPGSYRLERGINHQQAVSKVNDLHDHPFWKTKMVRYYRNEEFHILDSLIRREL